MCRTDARNVLLSGDNQGLLEDLGMLAALEAAGVVRLTGTSVDTGQDGIAVCELLVEPPWKQ